MVLKGGGGGKGSLVPQNLILELIGWSFLSLGWLKILNLYIVFPFFSKFNGCKMTKKNDSIRFYY